LILIKKWINGVYRNILSQDIDISNVFLIARFQNEEYNEVVLKKKEERL